MSDRLYRGYDLRRVYYSAFSPIPEASAALPLKAPPLKRENRLYQADWLLRYYGFAVAEIVEGATDGMLDLEIDPKLAWALKNRHLFPVDLNKADRAMLLRVPGLGSRAVERIIASRRHASLRLAELRRLTGGFRRALPFVTTPDHRPVRLLDRDDLRRSLAPLHAAGHGEQLGLFA